MLYLEAPYYYVNGVTVFRDHADPLQYYYMPSQPRLRTQPDANGVEVPRLQLIKYRSLVAGVGGFLTFDVHVGLSEKEVDDIASEIRRLARLPAMPRVAPIQPIDGSVRLLIFGQDSGAAPPPTRTGAPPPPAPAPRFVVKMQHFAKPALFGDNGAAFSVELDEHGTAIMEKAMQGEISPIVVVYSLDYAALRPAYSVRLTIDWDRVQTALDESFGHESVFTSVEIGNEVDKLIENRAIVMEADNFVPDADDTGKAVADRFESARMRVQEMITDSFFEASLEPDKERPDGWDKATGMINNLAAIGTTGGISALIGKFSYKKTTYQRIDKRKLDVEISERSAVVRTIHPQGTVSGLFRQLEAGLDINRFILSVDADDPFFEKRRVRVINRSEMVRDELVSVSATLTYGSGVESAILSDTGGEQTVEWLSQLDADGAVSRPVEYEYTVAFKPDAGGERPLSVTSEPQTLTGDVLEIQPAELYSRVTIPVIASPSYPWDKYPQVQVRLRYEDPGHGIKTDDTIVLKKDSAPQSWTFVALDKARRDFQVRMLHSAADNEDVDSGWLPIDGDLVDVRDPFGALRLAVDVVPVVARWEDLEQIFVDLEYVDDANDVRENAALTFTAEDKAPKQFVIDRKDVAHKLVSFRVTTIFKGGMVTEVPQSFTNAPRILIRPDMRGHRIVSVAPPDMVRAKLDRVEVELRYVDEANGITVEDRAVFDGAARPKTFEFDYVDPAREAFEWRAKYVFENGMTQESQWAEADGDTLTVTVPR
ncbi:hypothetical protein [Sphingomonas sp. MS122]|uniref:hypothetical protein n=1 Tax=Sphingomonas sp. MS122 TaxID=3412683 RepID=UPI003C2C0378